jgi:hypothetical protein
MGLDECRVMSVDSQRATCLHIQARLIPSTEKWIHKCVNMGLRMGMWIASPTDRCETFSSVLGFGKQ